MPQSGNAPKFIEFIKRELIPKIESTYRVTNDRTLMEVPSAACSLFYSMFEKPDLFNRCVLTSPALGWTMKSYTYEKRYAERKRLFLSDCSWALRP